MALPAEARRARASRAGQLEGARGLRGGLRSLVMLTEDHLLAFPPNLAPGIALCLRCGLLVDPLAGEPCDPDLVKVGGARLVLDWTGLPRP